MLLKRKRSEEGKRRDIFGGGDIKPVRVGYINAEGGGRRIRMMMRATGERSQGDLTDLGEEMRSLDFLRNGQFPSLLFPSLGGHFMWSLAPLVWSHADSQPS